MKELKISLRAARVNAGLTQEEVAKRIGKNKQTVINWENGRTPIDLGNFALLCNMYGFSERNIILPT